MAMALLLALQAGSAGGAPIRSDFDLKTYRPAPEAARDCGGAGEPDEIVVCGRRPLRNEYPLEEMERRFATKPLVAETDMGGSGKARAYVESVEMPGGQTSKRIMFGIKLPF